MGGVMTSDADIDRARAANVMAILDRRGFTLTGRSGWRCGPCPTCGGTDRFAVHPKKRAFNCRACGASGSGAIDLVAFLDDLDARRDFGAIVQRILTESKDDDDVPPPDDAAADSRQHGKALWLWRRRKPITGTLAEKYLHARGIVGPLPGTLAFLPPAKSEQHPAMIA